MTFYYCKLCQYFVCQVNFVYCHQYLNVNSPCQCRSLLKRRQTLRGPRLFTAETLSMRQKKRPLFSPTRPPLGRVGHRVAMSVCLCVCVSVCAIECSFFRGLSLALKSHDQIQASHCSDPLTLMRDSRMTRA